MGRWNRCQIKKKKKNTRNQMHGHNTLGTRSKLWTRKAINGREASLAQEGSWAYEVKREEEKEMRLLNKG